MTRLLRGLIWLLHQLRPCQHVEWLCVGCGATGIGSSWADADSDWHEHRIEQCPVPNAGCLVSRP